MNTSQAEKAVTIVVDDTTNQAKEFHLITPNMTKIQIIYLDLARNHRVPVTLDSDELVLYDTMKQVDGPILIRVAGKVLSIC